MRICGTSSLPLGPSITSDALTFLVRPRPWHPEKEAPFLAQHVDTPFFLGEGNFAQPKKAPANGSLREIVGECSSLLLLVAGLCWDPC